MKQDAEDKERLELALTARLEREAARSKYLADLKAEQDAEASGAGGQASIDDVTVELGDPSAVGGGGESPSHFAFTSPQTGDVTMRKNKSTSDESRDSRSVKKEGYKDTSVEAAQKARFRSFTNNALSRRRNTELAKRREPVDNVESVGNKRPLLYTGEMEQWKPYAEGVEVVAAHVRSLLNRDGGWAVLHLASNAYTEIIYDWFVLADGDQQFQEILVGISSIQQIKDEYTVLAALTANGEQPWQSYLETAKDKLGTTRQQAYGSTSEFSLGSDLHTTPADASADLKIDRMATRLDRLRDW